MATKTETFFLETEEEAVKFCLSCTDEGFEARVMPVEDHDGRKQYPVRVKYDTTKLTGKGAKK